MGRMGKFNISGLDELQRELKEIQAEREAFVEGCAKELAARLLAAVIKRTPVGVAPKDIYDNRETLVKATGASGKKEKFLSREASIYQQYWSGYNGGTLRRGWISKSQQEAQSGKGSPQADEVLAYVKGIEVSRIGGIYKIEIVNPVEYASYVEYGHRQESGRYVPALGKKLKRTWVPGQLMMTKSEREIQEIAPKVLEAKIKKFLSGCMK